MKTNTHVRGPFADKKINPPYTGKDLPTHLWPWQAEVLERCKLAPNDREINYIIDTRGNTGKSKFAKYMWYHHGAIFLPWGKTGDILNYVCKNKDAGIYFFDLSRSKPADWARDDISAAMEQIKNGMIVNLKYETCGTVFDPPHVWCFSNQPPNLSSMSRDRWAFWLIDDSKSLIPCTNEELHTIMLGSKNRSSSPSREPTVE